MSIDVSAADFREHCNNYDGICLSCEQWTVGSVEPDAENYVCDLCDENKVMGAELALMTDNIAVTSEQ